MAIASSSATVIHPGGNLASLTVTIANLKDGNSKASSSPARLSPPARSAEASPRFPKITATFAAGVLTLAGIDSPGDYQSLLQSIQYEDTATSPNTSPRIITVVANDAIAASGTATTTITITAPVVATAREVQAFTVSKPPVSTVAARVASQTPASTAATPVVSKVPTSAALLLASFSVCSNHDPGNCTRARCKPRAAHLSKTLRAWSEAFRRSPACNASAHTTMSSSGGPAGLALNRASARRRRSSSSAALRLCFSPAASSPSLGESNLRGVDLRS